MKNKNVHLRDWQSLVVANGKHTAEDEQQELMIHTEVLDEQV